ncbi:MAG: hypothetical protein AAB480_00185 [Patescibacteria group bacterium]
MGEVVGFPDLMSMGTYKGFHEEPATVIILPVIRVERAESNADSEPNRRRRRRNPKGPSTTVEPAPVPPIEISAATKSLPFPRLLPPQFAPTPVPGVLMPLMTYRSDPAYNYKGSDTSFVSAAHLAKTLVLQLEGEVREIRRAIELVKKETDNNGKSIGVLYASVTELESLLTILRNVR